MIAMTEFDKVITTNTANWTPETWKSVNTISQEDALGIFNFEMYKKQSYAYDPATGIAREIPGHFHLERSTDNGIIPTGGSVGEQFTPVQHKVFLEQITKEIMPNMPDAKLEFVATFHGGGTGIVSLRMGDEYQIHGDNSPQITRLLFTNPSNGTSLTLGFTNVRIVCQNTLMAAISSSQKNAWKIRHTKTAEVRCNNAVKQIRASVDAAIEMRQRCEMLAHIGCGSSMLASALDALLPIYGLEEGSPVYNHMIDKRNEVIRQFECGETAQSMKEKSAWTLFNSFTFPIFNPSRISTKTDRSQIQYKGMVGDTAKEVRQIFETISEIAAA